MVKFIKRAKVYLKNKFIIHLYIFLSKIFTVFISALALLLLLGFFNYEYNLKNFISCIALYFIIEELKIYLLRGKRL